MYRFHVACHIQQPCFESCLLQELVYAFMSFATVLKGHRDCITSVQFSVDDKSVISASADQTVSIWDMFTGLCTSTLRGHISAVWSVAVNANGTKIATASLDNTIKIWDTATRSCTLTLFGHSGMVLNVTNLTSR